MADAIDQCDRHARKRKAVIQRLADEGTKRVVEKKRRTTKQNQCNVERVARSERTEGPAARTRMERIVQPALAGANGVQVPQEQQLIKAIQYGGDRHT